jgi:SAM-dependent methyltransferase
LGETLELGSGYGVMARRVAERASVYVGLELTVDQAKALEEIGAAGAVADIHALPFGGETFDTIIADNVIEHAHDPLAALKECFRVLRPGGSAFLVIPNDYLGSRFRNRSHFWKADEASVRLAAELAGFKIARQKTLRLAEHGVAGAFPSSGGTTGLWELAKPKAA